MLEILIRENGGEPKWVAASKVLASIVKRKPKSNSLSPPTLKEVEGFDLWWNLYSYKKGKSAAEASWRRNVKTELIPIIMKHSKDYVNSTPDKTYRKHPSTYLNSHSWNDEITQQEEKIDLDLHYPLDKSNRARLGRCSKCNKIHFGDIYKILSEDSSCCKEKINKYR